MKPFPALKTYDTDHLKHIALPLGGIGTGTVSLGGRGDLRDWEIMNSPAKTFTPTLPQVKNLGPFFALRTACQGKKTGRLLEGPLDLEMEDPEGCRQPNAHFPRFTSARFRTTYPLAEVELEDARLPVKVTLQAMNPFIPGDSAASSLPIAHLQYHLHNTSSHPVTATIAGTLVNIVGVDGSKQERAWGGRKQYLGWKDNRNARRDAPGLRGIHFDSLGVDPTDPAWGTMALTAWDGEDAGHRTSWGEASWGDGILDFWDEFTETGALTDRPGKGTLGLLGSLASRVTIPPGETRALTFALTWHFPNRRSWHPRKANAQSGVDFTREDTVGNLYTTRFSDAWQVVEKILPGWNDLTARTVAFAQAMVESPLPPSIVEAALFNASTLRTQTCFQTPDGNFFGWEGIHDFDGSCYGSCTHVWNYEQATAHLFGDLARSMREVEFLHATDEEGAMRFRAQLPLSRNAGKEGRVAAADGQMGTLMKLYREYRLSGDLGFLKRLWPKAKAAMAFTWVPGGWDADEDGVMEGCQHNTMDVEYFGPNGQMQTWYLGALRASEEMARAAGDPDFASRCRRVYEKGRDWTDAYLFNGEYYEQEVRKPEAQIHPTLRMNMGSALKEDPDFQLGRACLIDQLVGDAFARFIGLGPVLDPGHIQTTLKSILAYNRRESTGDVMNPMRLYVLPDEPAVLMATWPRGERPKRPFPYHSEVMTGFEHLLGSHLLASGMAAEGEQVIADVRRRYDGKRRNPFNEAECGHHYARAMAAWGSFLAATGFQYEAATGTLSLKSIEKPTVFSWGGGWGTFSVNVGKVRLRMSEGRLPVTRVLVDGKEVPFQVETGWIRPGPG